MKKDIKNWIFIIFRFLFLIILVYKPEKFDSISYAESIIFISFELFFILIFYIKKIYIKYLKIKMIKYLLFCFLLIQFFSHLKKIYIEWMITIIIITIPILILMLFLYSVIKKNKFYLGYAIIELIWFIIFFFINGISSIPELNTLKLDVIYIFLAYTVISCLYLSLFKKNESKKVDE